MSVPSSSPTQKQSGRTPPAPSRPYIPEYGIPEGEEGMLPWDHVAGQMAQARNYWIATTAPDGRPHATPVWGVWLDETFYFDGSPRTRRGRNLAQNPAVTIHLESGDQVVIFQGDAFEIKKPKRAFTERLAAGYAAKYAALGYAPSPDTWDNGGVYVLRPRQVFAWTKFPEDATRWRFEDMG